jgi:hypothetical protein
MKCMERLIQKVDPGKWEQLLAKEKRFDVVETRLGYPNTRRYRCFAGASDTNTRVCEREWGSLSAFEATFEKALADPEWQALAAEPSSAVLSNQWELYLVQ